VLIITSATEGYTGSLSFTVRIVYYWLLLGGVSIVASIVEIVLIYYVHLTSAIKVQLSPRLHAS